MFVGYPYRASRERYCSSVSKAHISDLWSKLTGRENSLVPFAAVAQYLEKRQQTVKGIQFVPLAQIIGSVGRASDFTRTFLPRSQVTCERWAQIDVLVNRLQPLPPVELYQIGAVYFVRDGHHRISVSRANSLGEIEAQVVEWASPVPLTVTDFQQDRWIQKFEQARKEQTMYYVIDADLAKHEYEERLQKAAHEHLCQAIQARQRQQRIPLRQSLGDWLIAAGLWLKQQTQPELAKLA
jgi:hypothetical protein